MEAPQFDKGQTEGMCVETSTETQITILILAEMDSLMQTKPRSGKAGGKATSILIIIILSSLRHGKHKVLILKI